MNFVYGFILASITYAFGQFAWILTMTTNPTSLGGWLPWAAITFGPALFYGLGVWSRSAEQDDWEHVVMETGIELDELLISLD